MQTETKQIVIVGAGIAGLTAAAYLVKNKYPVLLLEKNDRSGGLSGTFEKDGFSFDSGPRAFVNSGIIRPILSDLGIEWNYLENKISIGIENQLFQVHSMDDLKGYQQILLDLYPESKNDIPKIIHFMRQLSEYTKVLYEFDNPSFSPHMRDTNYIFKKLIPWLIKFLHANQKLHEYKIPIEVFLKRLTENQSLIDVITQHFFRGTPTYFALGYFYVYLDYFYPRGGTGAIINLLRDKILGAGGEIKLNQRISEVLPSEFRVIDSGGARYPYDYLIWAADLKTLYRSINPRGLEPKTHQKIESKKQQVLSSKGAESVFIIYLAVNRPPAYFQEHGGEHIFFTPSKSGLGEIHRKERERLLEDFDHSSKDEILDWLDRYIHLNTYEISVPVLRDSTLAPEGQTGVMISCLFDYEIFQKIDEAGWYDEFKVLVENQICDIISKTIYKGIDQDILFKYSSSPLTIHKICGSSEGAITGWSFEKEPPVINKLEDIPKSVQTPVPNIFQAGQWAYSPAGVPIAMLTGWYAAQKIIRLTKKSRPG
jgi:phytoene dehydrogenase-like protein